VKHGKTWWNMVGNADLLRKTGGNMVNSHGKMGI
jgi:hypothetical protein